LTVRNVNNNASFNQECKRDGIFRDGTCYGTEYLKKYREIYFGKLAGQNGMGRAGQAQQNIFLCGTGRDRDAN